MPDTLSHNVRHPGQLWRSLSLAQQFVMASSSVLLVGMIVMGSWVSDKIQTGVTQNAATATALYMDSFIAPLVQELADKDRLSEATRAKLDRLLTDRELASRIVSLKIWKPGGLVVYSNHISIIGKTFPETTKLKSAWRGVVAAEFDDLGDEEDETERRTGLPLLEMYSPIRDINSGRIIAVAEFYEDATSLKREMFNTKLESWMFVAIITLTIAGLLYGIVRRGSRTIDKQSRVLEGRVEQLSKLLRQNEALRKRARQSSLRSTEINEHFLRRVSAELHDGPAQLIGLGLLRLDGLGPSSDPDQPETPRRRDLETIRSALKDALEEIRNLSSGLALPALEHLNFEDVLEKAVHTHEKRSRTRVGMSFSDLPDAIAMPFKISAYRFVQESLANAFLHGRARDQQVAASYDGVNLNVEVSDKGPGFDTDQVRTGDGLGLLGLRERIECLGGRFDIQSDIGEGTRVKASIPYEPPGGDHD